MELRGRWANALGWSVTATLALLAFGGAAKAPGHVMLGGPGARVVLVVLAVAAVLAWACRPERGTPMLGLAFVPFLLLIAAPLPGLRALSGPPLLALSIGGVTATLASSPRRPPPAVLFAAVLAVYATVAWRVQRQVGPQGDE